MGMGSKTEVEIIDDRDPQQGSALARFAAPQEDAPLPDYQTPQSLAVSLSRAEIDQQISTARAYPRSITTLTRNIFSLATMDEETAKECVYALPRAGKAIKGPSIRLAEIIASQWGNCRVGARVVHVDRMEKFIEAEGVFHDLETNTATTSRVRRRISDKRGRLLNDDMIVVTGNAAASIAKRNAILGGIPKAVWRRAYAEVEHVIAGDVKTLTERRGAAVKAFAAFGVTPDQIFAALEVPGIDDIGIEELVTLTAMHSAIRSGEATVEEMFATEKSADATTLTPAAKTLKEFASGTGGGAAATTAGGGGGGQGIVDQDTGEVTAGKGGGAPAAKVAAEPATVVAEKKPAAKKEKPAAEKPPATAANTNSSPGPAGDEPSGVSSQRGAIPAGAGAEPGGGHASSSGSAAGTPGQPLSADQRAKLIAYADALGNQMSASGLQKVGFRVFGEDFPEEGTTIGNAVKRVFDIHTARLHDDIEPANAVKAVRAILAELP